MTSVQILLIVHSIANKEKEHELKIPKIYIYSEKILHIQMLELFII